jgi:hypothetical protein
LEESTHWGRIILTMNVEEKKRREEVLPIYLAYVTVKLTSIGDGTSEMDKAKPE